jgi:hypothetical protein
MGKQWLRACSLVVADAGGKGLELGELRVTFQTRKGDTETPNNAEIRVYNLSEATASKVRKEFTKVVLQAGYQDSMGVIFQGTVRQYRQGRENGTDTWLEIIAADGDRAYNFAVVNKTLAAGSKPADRVKACGDAFAAKGTEQGYTPELPGNALPRSRVMYGPARKFMREEARNTDCSWSIQDGQATMIENKGVLPGEAVVLTYETGLIGAPEQTNEGIKVRCLLNPQLKIGGRIKLDNASVQEAKTDLKGQAQRAPKKDADGFYRILKVEFVGDTRGNDWYADMICIAMDDTSRTPLDMVK